MKKSPALFLLLIFLNLFKSHLSSDPDSVIVQSPEDNAGKTGKVQVEESQEKAFISADGSGSFIRTYMRPFVINSQRVWKEMRRETLNLKQDLSPFQTAWTNFRIGRPISRTTEKSIINANNEQKIYNKSQEPSTRVKGNNKSDDRNSETINSSPVTTETYEEYPEVENPENVAAKSTGKISPDSNFFAGIVNDFAFKLMEAANLESNFVISPLSIFVALSMCYLGADGNTKAQIERALGMDDNAIHGEHFHQGMKALLSLVLKDSRDYKLLSANGMFLGQNFTVDALFKENVKNYYDAELKNIDFGNFQLSQQIINDWVAQNTKGMIRRIINLPPPPLTSLILLNAVYFEGYWKVRFPHRLTFPGKFQPINGEEKEILFMRLLDSTFPVFRSDEHKHSFIKLPYEGDQLSMIVALPFTKEQKPMLNVTDQILCHVRDAMVETELATVAIPKCRLEYRKSLLRPLLKLGISDIFNANVADLTKMRKEKDVYASAVIHKAVVQLNEAGTTAAASTSVRFTPLSAPLNSTTFVADHPFAFYIVHEASGLVLFYGKVFDFDTIERGNRNVSAPHGSSVFKRSSVEYSRLSKTLG